MNVKWIPTDKHVYGAIYREHYQDMSVFASCTCPDGDLRLGYRNPYIMTAWGFNSADESIIKSVATKQTLHQEEYDYQYWIAVYLGESDE